MRSRPLTAAVAVAACLTTSIWIGAETAAAEDRYVKRAVVHSERDWTELGNKPTEDQILAADNKKLVVDARTPEALVLSVKMAEIPSNAPGTPGVHGSYSVSFKTVNRHGRVPIEGHLQADSFYGYVSSTVDLGQGRQPCPGSAMIDPETDWVTFAISKACFPGRQRVISGFGTRTGAFLYVERSDGVVDDTEDYAVDQTATRRQGPLWLR